MEYKRIEELLDRYLKAETSIQEEELLRRYFQQQDVPPHLEEYRLMFRFFSQAGKETMQPPAPPKRRFSHAWMGAAAAVITALGVFGLYRAGQTQQAVKEAEARQAYEHTLMALELVSENLERGTQQLAYLNQFEVAKSKIIKK